MLEMRARLNRAINQHGRLPTSAKPTFHQNRSDGFHKAKSGSAKT